MFCSRSRLVGALFGGALTLAACGGDAASIVAPAETPDTSPTPTADTPAPTAAPAPTTAPESTSRPTPPPASEEAASEPAPAPTVDVVIEDTVEIAAVAGNADPADATVTISLEVAGGSVAGGAQRHEVAAGDVVLIEVTLGEPGEVHLHGYDYSVESEEAATVQIAFVADIPGVWELELEGPGVHLLELQVS